MQIRMFSIFFAVLLCAPVISASADEQVRIEFRPNNTVTGWVNDGAIIGKGRLTFYGAHSGFQLWSEARKNEGQPEHYMLEGRQDVRNTLRVRLVNTSGSADQKQGRGIIILTSDNSVFFDVIADGEQKVNADFYPMEFQAAALEP